MTEAELQPIRKVLVVGLAVDEAFAVFTRDISRWWPLSRQSLALEQATGCVLETREGGSLYEVWDSAPAQVWGRLVTWSPPDLLMLAWGPGDLEDAETLVEIRFSALGRQRSRVELIHSGWRSERLERCIDHQQGWNDVLVKGYQAYVQRLVEAEGVAQPG
jgi:hypothetical protein